MKKFPAVFEMEQAKLIQMICGLVDDDVREILKQALDRVVQSEECADLKCFLFCDDWTIHLRDCLRPKA